MKIAVCITTFNRPEILLRGLVEQWKFLPKGAKIFVVDDGSTDKPDMSGFPAIEFVELPQNRGIAAAKNKCLELAEDWGADHIFLFDSDCWPKRSGWEKPYIASKEPHLMYMFTKFATDGPNGHNLTDCVEIYRDSEIVAFSHVRGCMLYVDAKILPVVGGFDERYGKAMFEHTDYSNRIHNNALTKFRVMDVAGSSDLIYSMDEHREAASSITVTERQIGLRNNRPLYAASLTSTEFKPYRSAPVGTRDIVMTGYFTSTPDFQREDQNWSADYKAIEPLINSVTKHGVDMVLLHDCFDLPNKYECTIDPYWNRFLRAYEYLRDNPDVRGVFMVDATDVTMLNNPFTDPRMDPRMLYVGDEQAKLGINWIRRRAFMGPFNGFVSRNQNEQLLNAGIIGGSRDTVLKFLHAMLTAYADSKMEVNDMVALNYVARSQFGNRLAHGTGLVNNVFKSFKPTEEATEWFNHK